ncbi:DUF952 domain-containing protein [Nostoc sp. CHAB 5784]|uniref:DUF952 domain-containing protein n=1 Tax=Nostoc mirabile TaxID=2907820 RepID=UPI001E4A6CCE|nr:DUF952 domain-containing protein [Nostoc mirabile]MCC5662970.1 DUF952 domain-containing protein [Nostoc mirabile CHAB5784]
MHRDRADLLDTKGFIHCSKLTQIVKVANNYFPNQKYFSDYPYFLTALANLRAY